MMGASCLFCLALVGGALGGEFQEKLYALPSFGSEVRDLDVPEFVARLEAGEAEAAAEAKWLSEELHRQRLLVFRGQGELPWQSQVAFSKVFGHGRLFNESLHGNRRAHPANPDDLVATFSNDIKYGATGVGVEGWHVDGNVVPVPHAVTLIHSIRAIEGGDTFFVPLREVTQRLREGGHLRGNCVERAPPCTARASREPEIEGAIALDDVAFRSAFAGRFAHPGAPDGGHPLIYPHPVTGHDTMIFGLGSLSGNFGRGVLQPALDAGARYSAKESDAVVETIEAAVRDTDKVLRWRWRSGDLLVVDNLALAHLAADGTQVKADDDDVGLRIMRRTTVEGRNTPSKRPYLHGLPHECVPEGDGHYCVFSLKRLAAERSAAATTREEEEEGGEGSPRFLSRLEATRLCKTLSPEAALAAPFTVARNGAAGRVVSGVASPHWLAADDAPNGVLAWPSKATATARGLETSGDAVEPWPWHEPSAQPNDCEGPDKPETCVFIGPDARWFDFSCEPKKADAAAGVTPGPEITWEDGVRREYDIYPLCGLFIGGDEANMIGLRTFH